ncbi:MAG: ArsR family transcriptional regulator [Candidatus Rokubacteria bacterium]|nr:ArsR family transcriptional regulator [Candidatus Rokubacteria bacterium]
MPEQLVGTKADILKLLLKQELSAKDLADALSVTPAAVRQHLDTLKAMGLIQRRKGVTQPSRPTFLYRLSRDGSRLFPKRYDLLLGLVIDVLLQRDGQSAVDDVVRAAAERLADRVRERFQRAGEGDRWQLVVNWLEEELAWEADVGTDQGGARHITIHQCPFQEVSRDRPDVCNVFFASLIRSLYGDVCVEKLSPPAPACCGLLVRP